MIKHKQQIFWQIYFPMLLIFGLFAFFTYSFFGKTLLSDPGLRIWSDIFLLIILLPLFFLFIFTFIFLFLIIYLISKSHSAIGAFLSNISEISIVISHWSLIFTKSLTQPLIQIESIISQMLPQKKENDKNG